VSEGARRDEPLRSRARFYGFGLRNWTSWYSVSGVGGVVKRAFTT
jgi:hypothetical protein